MGGTESGGENFTAMPGASMPSGAPRGADPGRGRAWPGGGLALAALLVAGAMLGAAGAQAAMTGQIVAPRVIHLPVIPQGNYLDPGPAGPPIRPDVSIGRGENSDYVFPPDLSGGYGSGPPGDPTNNGSWSPLDGDTPSF